MGHYLPVRRGVLSATGGGLSGGEAVDGLRRLRADFMVLEVRLDIRGAAFGLWSVTAAARGFYYQAIVRGHIANDFRADRLLRTVGAENSGPGERTWVPAGQARRLGEEPFTPMG